MPRPAAHARRVVALLSLAAAFVAPQTRTRHQRLHAKKPPPKKRDGRRLKIATNRKARLSYEIVRTMEAGIALQGTEVKSCRNNNVNLRDGFARVEGGSVWLHNVDIAPHATTARYFQHEAKAKRRLLLHKAEIRKQTHATS